MAIGSFFLQSKSSLFPRCSSLFGLSGSSSKAILNTFISTYWSTLLPWPSRSLRFSLSKSQRLPWLRAPLWARNRYSYALLLTPSTDMDMGCACVGEMEMFLRGGFFGGVGWNKLMQLLALVTVPCTLGNFQATRRRLKYSQTINVDHCGERPTSRLTREAYLTSLTQLARMVFCISCT